MKRINERQFEVECAACGGAHLVSIAGMTEEGVKDALTVLEHGGEDVELCPTCSAAARRIVPLLEGRGVAVGVRPGITPEDVEPPRKPSERAVELAEELIVELADEL